MTPEWNTHSLQTVESGNSPDNPEILHPTLNPINVQKITFIIY